MADDYLEKLSLARAALDAQAQKTDDDDLSQNDRVALDSILFAIDEMNRRNEDWITKLTQILEQQLAAQSALQTALMAALAEARQPITIDVNMVMPEQKPRRFIAERGRDGTMTLTEEMPTLQ